MSFDPEERKIFTASQRLKILYILDYLKENTDSNHAVSRDAIINYLDNLDVSSERKSLTLDMEMLNYYTDDAIIIERGKYRLIERDFELQELQLLIDSVQSSKFITQKMADSIIKKIMALTSIYERRLLSRHNYVVNRIRSQSDSGFLNADTIHESITNNCRISFEYFRYNVRKEKLYYKKIYKVSPFSLLWSENNYYMIAYDGKTIKHFRVDKMDHIEMLPDDKSQGESYFSAINLSKLASSMFSMFHGKEAYVKMRFQNRFVDAVVERFGYDIVITTDKDDNHFYIKPYIQVSPPFYGWLIGFGTSVKIIEPDWVVEDFRKYVLKVFRLYKAVKKDDKKSD